MRRLISFRVVGDKAVGLSELCIRRPVLALVMSLMLLLVGFMCFDRLPVREYPDIDVPVVSVRTVYRGASSEVMESQVTRPLEDSLSGIEGIRTLKSVSREEVSQITIEFLLSRDQDSAAADVRDRVSRIRARLPEEIDEPVISKVQADAQPILWLALSSEQHSALEITDYADRVIQDKLQTLPGVASVLIAGERRYAMRIWLDRERMAASGITVQDVENALNRRNVEMPGGRLESQQREFTVFSPTDLKTVDEFNQLILAKVNGYLIRLADVGRAELGAEDERNIVRVNGLPAVGLGIVKQSTANTLAVASAVKKALPGFESRLPEGMQLRVSFDTSLFIDESLKAVYHAIAESLVLVTLVTFLFLRSFRATLIPFVTIPVSLLGAFIFLYALDFSINILTLLALVLAIGLVVDDAIVMLENIYRRMESTGASAMQAAREGSREITFAVIAMTVTLAAVFTPLAFLTGNVGRLFAEFALAVSCAVIVSGFIALTLTPMMCSRLLRVAPGIGHKNTEDGFYPSLLRWLLRRRLLVLPVILMLGLLGGWLYSHLPAELSPLEDRGSLIVIATAPEGASLAYMDRYARQIEAIVDPVAALSSYFMVVAPGLDRPTPVNLAMGFLRFKPWDMRDIKQQAVAAQLTPALMALPGVMAFPVNPPSLGQSFRNPPLQFVIQGPGYAELDGLVSRFLERMRAYPGLVNTDSDLKLDKPQLDILVDRNRAADLGVDIDEIGRTLQVLLGGRQITRFKKDGEQYDVVVQLSDEQRVAKEDIKTIYVRSQYGQLVQLSSVVDMRERGAAKELNHFNRLRSSMISANIAPGYTLGQALDFMKQTATELLGQEFAWDLDGQSREFNDSGRGMWLTFVFAMLFIYLVLAAQFESFADPLVIMLTVPLAVTGALLALWLTGGTLNVYSQIGMVMLIGLITKNGILIVEFANHLRTEGSSKVEAVVMAASMRLRPIVMTTLTMMLGAVPLALATGAGAESRMQIGWVIVGGLFMGTLFTLVVIPVAYVSMPGRASGKAQADAPLIT
jgi:multidrug efflux pump